MVSVVDEVAVFVESFAPRDTGLYYRGVGIIFSTLYLEL